MANFFGILHQEWVMLPASISFGGVFMSLRKLLFLGLVGLSYANAYAMATAVLFNQDGTPRCQIKGDGDGYSPEVATLRECEERDEIYAEIVDPDTEIQMAGAVGFFRGTLSLVAIGAYSLAMCGLGKRTGDSEEIEVVLGIGEPIAYGGLASVLHSMLMPSPIIQNMGSLSGHFVLLSHQLFGAYIGVGAGAYTLCYLLNK